MRGGLRNKRMKKKPLFAQSFVVVGLKFRVFLSETPNSYENNHYHEECLKCNSCGMNLSGPNQKRARRFKNQVSFNNCRFPLVKLEIQMKTVQHCPECFCKGCVTLSDSVWPPLRWHGPDGVLRLHAAAPQLQAPEPGVRGRQEKELNHAHIPSAAAGLFG